MQYEEELFPFLLIEYVVFNYHLFITIFYVLKEQIALLSLYSRVTYTILVGKKWTTFVLEYV